MCGAPCHKMTVHSLPRRTHAPTPAAPPAPETCDAIHGYPTGFRVKKKHRYRCFHLLLHDLCLLHVLLFHLSDDLRFFRRQRNRSFQPVHFLCDLLWRRRGIRFQILPESIDSLVQPVCPSPPSYRRSADASLLLPLPLSSSTSCNKIASVFVPTLAVSVTIMFTPSPTF